jgi:hypothetical protein
MNSRLSIAALLLMAFVSGFLLDREFRARRAPGRRPPAQTARARPFSWRRAAPPPAAPSPANPTLDIGGFELALDRALQERSPARRAEALFNLAESVAAGDIPRALAILAKRRGAEAGNLANCLLARLAHADPSRALAYVQSLSSPSERQKFLPRQRSLGLGACRRDAKGTALGLPCSRR